jgi:hypothetical protein
VGRVEDGQGGRGGQARPARGPRPALRERLGGKSRGDLDAAIGLVKSASTVEEAQKKLTVRLGKPTWTENGQKRVWVANDGSRCHRLVLEQDGSVSVDTAAKSDWNMLSALAKQNACTGEIKRGTPGSS